MSNAFTSTVNLRLPLISTNKDPETRLEIQELLDAIRILQKEIDILKQYNITNP